LTVVEYVPSNAIRCQNKSPIVETFFFPEKISVNAVEGQMLVPPIMPSLFVLKVSPAIRYYKGNEKLEMSII
jgi:hypothetical protein